MDDDVLLQSTQEFLTNEPDPCAAFLSDDNDSVSLHAGAEGVSAEKDFEAFLREMVIVRQELIESESHGAAFAVGIKGTENRV